MEGKKTLRQLISESMKEYHRRQKEISESPSSLKQAIKEMYEETVADRQMNLLVEGPVNDLDKQRFRNASREGLLDSVKKGMNSASEERRILKEATEIETKAARDTLLHRRKMDLSGKYMKQATSLEGKKDMLESAKRTILKGKPQYEGMTAMELTMERLSRKLDRSKELIREANQIASRSDKSPSQKSVKRHINKKIKQSGMKVIKGGLKSSFKLMGAIGLLYELLDQPAVAAPDLPPELAKERDEARRKN